MTQHLELSTHGPVLFRYKEEECAEVHIHAFQFTSAVRLQADGRSSCDDIVWSPPCLVYLMMFET